ncbi:Rdx family-domain-containing protein [Lipomyces kononenkoae]|uniref:Rdx family-domain-containing protein n=1 Tax=Lipomyces kononenkoae TaxID=34357 RepID=A0ACC3T462_LIPKO
MPATIQYPHISIEFCTACKWNLRAAWYAQELLSTFSNELGEVSMIPSGGGTFIVRLTPKPESEEVIIWNRKINNGFPDSKDLKRLIRDVLFPTRDLGHVDRHAAKKDTSTETKPATHSEVATTASTKDESDESKTDLILDDNDDVCKDCNIP